MRCPRPISSSTGSTNFMSAEYTPRVAAKNFTPRVPDRLSPTRAPRVPQPLQWHRGGARGLSDASSPDPWQIVAASGGGYTLRGPAVVWSYDDLATTATITNTTFALEAGKWVVAKALGPTATFIAAPALEIDLVSSEWTWYPNAHKFDEADPYAWLESYIPIWKLVAEADATADMVLVGENTGGDPIYGKQFAHNLPRLAFNLVSVGTPSRLRAVPEFF